MPEYWFTADTHFGHANIIKYAERPFANVREMDEEMIRQWNECVEPGDIVFHLGDFAFVKNAAQGAKILERLNGQVILIKGNHDRTKMVKKMGFAAVHHLYSWRVPPAKVRLLTMCHFPMLMWRDSHMMEWHAHGHCHGLLPDSQERLSIDVGVDCWEYYPVHLDELSKKFRKKEKGWKSLIMKHDRPHGCLRDGWNVYALCAPHGHHGHQRWLKDVGENWETQKGMLIPKNEKDRVRVWCWAKNWTDIANRLPKGGAKGVRIPGAEDDSVPPVVDLKED